MSLIFDAGAFVAIERGDRDLVALIKRERLANRSPLTHGGVIGQVWRGGFGRQANLDCCPVWTSALSMTTWDVVPGSCSAEPEGRT